jgi:hypothetical protein
LKSRDVIEVKAVQFMGQHKRQDYSIMVGREEYIRSSPRKPSPRKKKPGEASMHVTPHGNLKDARALKPKREEDVIGISDSTPRPVTHGVFSKSNNPFVTFATMSTPEGGGNKVEDPRLGNYPDMPSKGSYEK